MGCEGSMKPGSWKVREWKRGRDSWAPTQDQVATQSLRVWLAPLFRGSSWIHVFRHMFHPCVRSKRTFSQLDENNINIRFFLTAFLNGYL